MHEIVTLQFGQQSNHIGTHFWNAQESYFTYDAQEESPIDHDVHFRPGVGSDGSETYTPRTVICDLKGAFGTLRRENALYSVEDPGGESASTPWRGPTNIIRETPIAQSAYQQHLDQGQEPPPLSTSTVRFWSDYNRLFYHPRSIVQLHEYELNSTILPFERWHTGEELFSNLDKEHDLLDRDLRPWLEECDQLQGVQLFTSVDDAWGGFAARYLERIRDELGKTSLWVWGSEDHGRKSREKQMLQAANVARSLYEISPQASMYIPITTSPSSLPSYVHGFDSSSKWHSSALQMSALETLILPSRLRTTNSARQTLASFEATLNNDGKRLIANLTSSATDPSRLSGASNGHSNNDSRMNGYDQDDSPSSKTKLDIDFTPPPPSFDPTARRERITQGSVFGAVRSLRGKWLSSLEIEEINIAARDRFGSGPRITTHQTDLMLPILDSFPSIFDFGTGTVKEVAVQASLSTNSGVAKRIRALERAARPLFGVEDREVLCDGLIGIAEEYEDGWDSDEEGDEDEA